MQNSACNCYALLDHEMGFCTCGCHALSGQYNKELNDQFKVIERRFCACNCHRGGIAAGLPFCCPCVNKGFTNKEPDFNPSPSLPILDELDSQVKKSFANAIADINEKVKQLFRLYNDLSELRHATNQNEGCTRAKVENDIIPALKDMREVNSSISCRINHLHERLDTLEKSIVDKDFTIIGETGTTYHLGNFEKCLTETRDAIWSMKLSLGTHIQNCPPYAIQDDNVIYEKCKKCENTTFQIRGHDIHWTFVCTACRHVY